MKLSCVHIDLESVFDYAVAFEQTLCSSTWLIAKGLFLASAKNSRVLCCDAGSYLLDSNTLAIDLLAVKANPWDPPIWAIADENICAACPTGQYTEDINLQTSCTTCPRNTIAPEKGLPNCANCKDPKFSNDGINCEICGAGTFTSIDVNKTQCEPCDAGLYQELVGNSTCNNCPAGWNQKDPGQPFCLPCAPGM